MRKREREKGKGNKPLTMPKGLAGTELLVFVDGLAAAATLGVAVRADHGLARDVARRARVAVGGHAAVRDARVRAAGAHDVLALLAEEHAVLARVAVELAPAEVLLALVADEAVQVVVLRAHHLVQQRARLLLAHGAHHVARLARAARRHFRRLRLRSRRCRTRRRRRTVRGEHASGLVCRRAACGCGL